MKKVILLAPTPPPVGGIAMWTSRMINAELKGGWQVEVVDEKIIGMREVFGDQVKRDVKAEIKRCFHIWGDLKKKLRDKEALVVHSCIPANTLPLLREYVCAWITKNRRKKFIVHFRCTVPNMVKSRLNRIVLKLICNKSDCVMVLNQQSADFVKSLSKSRIQLIPNFVESKELEDRHTVRDRIEKVLYVGGVIETKGCLDLIEVAKAFPNIEFKLIGNSNSAVSEAARAVDNVILTGVQDHETVHKELMEADVFAFLSYFSGEGFSNALAEAMACGVPCLVSDWAANADMIENKGGYVVPIRSPENAVAALEKMMPASIRQEQSAFNVSKIKSVYASEVVLGQYVDCYEACLEGQDKNVDYF